MNQRVLIAGIGNIFLQDDGFGVEVVHRLGAETLPEGVRVADFGIVASTWPTSCSIASIDATDFGRCRVRGEEPGTVYVSSNRISKRSMRENRRPSMRTG